MTLAHTLGTFATGPITPDTRMTRFVHCSLYDWATVGLAGRDEPVARAARAMALETAGTKNSATVFGAGRASPAAAALANGAASHALDYDDTHFGYLGHPSVAVVPAALALAEAKAATGADFIEALTVGLETACRVGAWMGRPHYEAGFHQTGTSGAFGATAAAGRILGLNADQMAQAFSLTATRAAGLKSQFGTMGKPLHAGFAAEVGVTTALLAQMGATSAPDALEGPQGFGPTHSGAAEISALHNIGQEWLFSGVSYKFHACCHGLHSMLEALRSIDLTDIPASAIDTVSINTHPRWLNVCNQPAPETGLQAKFSYRLTAAMVLGGLDTAALDVYSAETCTRGDICALRDRVTVIPDDTLSDSEAQVCVTAGETVRSARHDILTTNDPDAIKLRLQDKSETLLGRDLSAALWEDICYIDKPDGPAVLAARIGTTPPNG
ncbi:2-methylcitrate dehydratase [Litorivita pollutaquae]|uniref:2-methylcitrate dehydratase n=1 Tax=Litorivita pollutaquae TaxID=2200892 RepID=A0A2V4MJW6_9RHOB|nr:MmgE/PrpD family protein [Litorivita pollutaquae]PYC46915.1 2-methylcitrate dehydratase [Litorivita pollutaquae]